MNKPGKCGLCVGALVGEYAVCVRGSCSWWSEEDEDCLLHVLAVCARGVISLVADLVSVLIRKME